MKVKNASELKAMHLNFNPDSHFFDRKTMQFFGDTMRNFGVINHGDIIELYRKKPVKHGIQGSHFFCAHTFKILHKYTLIAEGIDVDHGLNIKRRSM